MVAGVALALTLLFRGVSGDRWSERLEQAQARSACEVEELLASIELERAAHPVDRELARAAYEAAFWLLAVDESELCCEPTVEARLGRARRLARETGAANGEDALRVENDRAFALLGEGRALEAQHLLLEALRAFPDAARVLPDTLTLLARATRSRGEALAARSVYEECLGRLDGWIDAARAQGAADELALPLELRCEVLGDLVQLLVDIGLVDPAAEQLDLLVESASELGSDASLVQADISACSFDLAVQDYHGLLEHARSGGRFAADDIERRTFALCELAALVELARDDRGQVDAARGALAVLAGAAASDGGRGREITVDVARLAFELALLRGDRAAARAANDGLVIALTAAAAVAPETKLARWRLQAATLRAALALAEESGRAALARARDELALGFDAFLESRLRLPPVPGGIGHLHWGDRRRVLSELVRLELTLDDTHAGTVRAFEAVLRAQSLGSFGRVVGAGATSLDEVRTRLLGSDTGLLVWLPALERSHLFAVDREGIECFELGSRDELLLAANRFTDLASVLPEDRAKDREERRARWLDCGRALLDALLPRAARVRVARWSGFYASGLELCENPLLEGVPWDDGTPLGARFAVARLPSVPIGVWLARRSRSASPLTFASADAVVLASPLHDARVRARWPELAPIRMTDAERRFLADASDAGNCLFLSDEQATAVGLRAACAQRPVLLELFTHGVYGVERDRPAGLILSGDGVDPGVLGCAEVERFEIMAPVVALYACGSARGPTRLGDDTSAQLANAFLQAGASSVVIARGDIAYEASIELARSFRRGVLARGLSPASALSIARRELAESEHWNDFFFHAPLSLVGLGLEPVPVAGAGTDGEPLAKRRATSSWGWLAAAGVALLACLLFVRARRR